MEGLRDRAGRLPLLRLRVTRSHDGRRTFTGRHRPGLAAAPPPTAYGDEPATAATAGRSTKDIVNDYLGRDASLIPVLGLLSVAAAVLQAAAVVLIAAGALSLAQNTRRTKLSAGPLSLDTSLGIAVGSSAVCALVMIGLLLFVGRVTARLVKVAESQCRRRATRAYLDTSWEVIAQRERGELQQILTNNVSRVARAVIARSVQIFSAANLVILVGTAFALSPILALVVISTGALLALPLRPIKRWTDRAATAHGAAEREFAVFVAGLVEQSREARVFHVGGALHADGEVYNERASEQQRRVQFLLWTTPSVYLGGVLLVLGVAIAVLSAAGGGHLEAVGPMILLLMRSLVYGQSALSATQALQEGLPYLRELERHVDLYSAATQSEGTADTGPLERLVFRDISYTYPGASTSALRHIDLVIRRGESIGLVGSTGSGKSTLAELVLMLRRVTGGSYTVNGVSAADTDRAAWARRVAYVPQQSVIFDGSIRENVRFHRPWITDDEVERACREAQIDTEIRAMSDGYETVVSGLSLALSGGQRQRVCIARALSGQPELLVMDEPTSGLDVYSERLFVEMIGRLKTRVTMIVIAHRLDTVALCDRIVVVDSGRIVAEGPPAETLKNGQFSRRNDLDDSTSPSLAAGPA